MKIIALLGAIQNLENGDERLVCGNLCQSPPQRENSRPCVSGPTEPKDGEDVRTLKSKNLAPKLNILKFLRRTYGASWHEGAA